MKDSSSGGAATLTAGFLGWTLDAFDYFLVVMALTDIGRTFGKTSTEMALSLTVTLACRPVGALIFGLMADRYGRRLPLMIDVIFYSIAEVLTGCAHSFGTFILCRAMFGIGMGGEWGVGASLAMEKVPPRLRGVLSGLLQEGYAVGFLLAALAYWAVFPHRGWRPLFFIGGLPAILVLFIRFHVPESTVWEKRKATNWRELARGIGSNWRIFLYLVALMTMMNLASHGTQDLYPTFLEKSWGFHPRGKSSLAVISMVGAIAGGIMFGGLSDRIGRRKAMVMAFIGAILAIPLWALPPNVGLLVAGAFLLQFMVQGAWGIIPAHISELSPDAIRGFMPGFAYQCGNLMASQINSFESGLVDRGMSYRYALASSALVIFIGAAIVTALGRERRGMAFGAGQQ